MDNKSKSGSGQASRQDYFGRSALSMNHLVTIDGKTLTVGEWCILRRLSVSTVMGRLRRGWSVEDALAFVAYGRPQNSTMVRSGAGSRDLKLKSPEGISDDENCFVMQMITRNISKWKSTNNKLYLCHAQFWIKSIIDD